MRALTLAALFVLALPMAASAEPDTAVTPGKDYYGVEVEHESPGSHLTGTPASKASQGPVIITAPNACDDQGRCELNPVVACPNPDETYVITWAYNADAGWHKWREGCMPSPEDSIPSITPDMVLRELERVGLPAMTVHTNPADKTLVNLDTIFYTDSSSVTRTLTLLGQSVLVEATPTNFAWEFGDGESASTNSPGAPYPALDITHRYADADVTMQPSVDTTYSGRFRVNGGPWTDIDGTVTIDGPSADLRVVEATPVLSGNR